MTEFIPVSSTAHLLLAGRLLGFTERRAGAFEVLIQLGAILALLVVYAARLWQLVTDLPRDRRVAALRPRRPRRLPAVGDPRRPLPRFITEVLFDSITLISHGADPRRHRAALPRPHAAPRRATPTSWIFRCGLRFGIGLFQCLSLIPGVSRSGATIAGALLLGTDKRAAAEFSFFLAMPTMAGAFVYDLYKNIDTIDGSAGGAHRHRLRRRVHVGADRGAELPRLRQPPRLRALRLVADRGRDRRARGRVLLRRPTRRETSLGRIRPDGGRSNWPCARKR